MIKDIADYGRSYAELKILSFVGRTSKSKRDSCLASSLILAQNKNSGPLYIERTNVSSVYVNQQASYTMARRHVESTEFLHKLRIRS